jgi:hypothetical protein
MLFGKEAEVQFMILIELKDICSPFPSRLVDGNGWVKSRNCEFQHIPEEVVSILGFSTNCQDSDLHLWIESREEAW